MKRNAIAQRRAERAGPIGTPGPRYYTPLPLQNAGYETPTTEPYVEKLAGRYHLDDPVWDMIQEIQRRPVRKGAIPKISAANLEIQEC
jgi:hypothetical protein